MEYAAPLIFPIFVVGGGFTAWITERWEWIRDRSNRVPTGDKKAASSGLAVFIAVVVTFVWAYAVVTDINNPHYNVPIYVHGIFAGIVGSIYGFKVVQGAVRGRRDDD